MDEKIDAGAVAGHPPEQVQTGPAPMRYPHNPIDAFQNGVMLDLRARLAVEFLKESPIMVKVAEATMQQVGRPDVASPVKAEDVPMWCAKFALDMADAFMKDVEGRGWVQPIPTYQDLEDTLKGHAKRTGAFSFMQQVGGGEAQQAHAKALAADAPRVQPVPGFPPAPGRKPPS